MPLHGVGRRFEPCSVYMNKDKVIEYLLVSSPVVFVILLMLFF